MKKFALIITLALILPFLGACSKRDLPTDVALEDGSYFYRNETLGFSLILPSSFEFYQTQRTSGIAYIDLEIFVPTGDKEINTSLPGYARPVLVRVFSKEAWKNAKEGTKELYKYIGDKRGNVYTILFWEEIPSDWEDKWQDGETNKNIIDSIELE